MCSRPHAVGSDDSWSESNLYLRAQLDQAIAGNLEEGGRRSGVAREDFKQTIAPKHHARAIACNPRLLIADEPTTALDVTIQAQILKLIAELQEKRDIGVIFITVLKCHTLCTTTFHDDAVHIGVANNVTTKRLK